MVQFYPVSVFGRENFKHRLKRAFTLVELVVVIAIIAILTAVSVAGYFGFTDQARQSNDVALVKQMNDTVALSLFDEDPLNVPRVRRIIAQNGIEDLSTSRKGNYIFYSPVTHKFTLERLSDMDIRSANESNDPDVYTYDAYPSTPETFISKGGEKYMLVSGNKDDALVSAVSNLRNLGDATDQNAVQIAVEKVNSIKNPDIRNILTQLLDTSVFVGSSDPVITPTTNRSIKRSYAANSNPDRVIFSENITTLTSASLPSAVNYSNVRYIVVPSTVTTVEADAFKNLSKDLGVNLTVTVVIEGGTDETVKNQIKQAVSTAGEVVEVRDGDMKEAYTYIRDSGIKKTVEFNNNVILKTDGVDGPTALDTANSSMKEIALLAQKIDEKVDGTYTFENNEEYGKTKKDNVHINSSNALQNPDGSYDVNVIFGDNFKQTSGYSALLSIMNVFEFVFNALKDGGVSRFTMVPEDYASSLSYITNVIENSLKYLETLVQNDQNNELDESTSAEILKSIVDCYQNSDSIAAEIESDLNNFGSKDLSLHGSDSFDITKFESTYSDFPIFKKYYGPVLDNLTKHKLIVNGNRNIYYFIIDTSIACIANSQISIDITESQTYLFIMAIFMTTTYDSNDYYRTANGYASVNNGVSFDKADPTSPPSSTNMFESCYNELTNGNKVRVIGEVVDAVTGKVSYIRYNFKFVAATKEADGSFVVPLEPVV